MSDITLNQAEEVVTILPVAEEVSTEETVAGEAQVELVAEEASVAAE